MLGGCDANQFYMGSKTVVGVNAAVNPEQNKGWLVVAMTASSWPSFLGARMKSLSQVSRTRKAGCHGRPGLLAAGRERHLDQSIRRNRSPLVRQRRLRGKASRSRWQTVKKFFDCFKKKPEFAAPAAAATTAAAATRGPPDDAFLCFAAAVAVVGAALVSGCGRTWVRRERRCQSRDSHSASITPFEVISASTEPSGQSFRRPDKKSGRPDGEGVDMLAASRSTTRSEPGKG